MSDGPIYALKLEKESHEGQKAWEQWRTTLNDIREEYKTNATKNAVHGTDRNDDKDPCFKTERNTLEFELEFFFNGNDKMMFEITKFMDPDVKSENIANNYVNNM